MQLNSCTSIGITFIFTLLWFNKYYFVKKLLFEIYKNENVIKNFIHIINAILTIFWSITNLFNDYLFILFFIAFYVFDIIYIFVNLEIKKNISNLLHHIFAIICSLIPLFYNNFIDQYKELGFMLEFSNLPLYLNYHFHKVYPNNKKLLQYSTLIQLLVYGYFRIIAFGMYFYYKMFIYKLDNAFVFILYISTISIYLMGIAWSYKLFVKVKNILLSNDSNKNN